MSFDGGFDSLGFDADVSLSNGGGTVLQEPLDKCNVVPAGFVNLSGVPLAETVGADALKTQVVTNDGKLLLNGALCDRENQVLFADAISQTVVLDVLCNDQRDSKHTVFPCLLFYDLKAEAVTIPNNVTGAEFDDVADPQPQVSLQDKCGCDTLTGTATAESIFHGLHDFLVLFCGESLSFLVHGDLQE